MYYCENCGRFFQKPNHYKETYGLPGGRGQIFYTCPLCGVEEEFREVADETL